MNVNAQSILGVTLILVALYLMLSNSAGTNTIITGLAESYGQVVAALQARNTPK